MKKNKYWLLGKVIASTLLLGMAMACPMVVKAEESTPTESGSVIYIYHSHVGNEEEGGGCYGKEKLHVHEGNSSEGGACYKTAVYHAHSGSSGSGGGCYLSPIYHSHRGDIYSGGSCYSPVYHVHNSESCYTYISSHELGCQVLSASDAGFSDGEGHEFHYYEMSCGQTILGTNAHHSHQTLSCGSEGVVVGYQLSCSKSNATIDGYGLSCGKTAGQTVEAYQLDCPLTEDTLIGYEKNCGKETDQIVGKVTITEQAGAYHYDVLLTAAFEDLSGGTLELSDSAFQWKDEAGNSLGSGSSIRVSENGTYQLEVGVASEDVDKDRLQGEVMVDGIVKPTPAPQESSSGSDNSLEKETGDAKEDGSQDTKETGAEEISQDSFDDTSGASGSELDTSDREGVSPTPSATPSKEPEAVVESREDSENGGGSSQNNRSGEESLKVETLEASPKPVKETMVKQAVERKAEVVEELEIGEVVEKKSPFKAFLELPAVKVISVAASTLLLLALLGLLLYYFRRSVRVYNDNGEGKKIYLGRCIVKLLEEGYAIEITDAMVEKAVTNRYQIRPGLFRLFREEEELLVCRKKRKIAVPMDKEMIVVI